MIVEIENAYSDGHTSTVRVVVVDPAGPADLADWWDREVSQHTGDGHGRDSRLGFCYSATIVDGPADLVGSSYEWIG